MARDSEEIIRLCAAALEESILALVEMGDDDAVTRCKKALVALIGGSLGREYADYSVRSAYQLVSLHKEEFAHALDQVARLENEIAQGFVDQMESVADVDDFLDACGDD
jgi:hypothetical protein